MKTAYRAAELADFLELELRGCPDTPISGLATLEDAGASDISFVANRRYLALLKDSAAGAVILSADHADSFPRVCLVSHNPYLSYAKLTHWFATAPQPEREIHPSSVVSADAVIASDCYIGPNAVVGAGASVASGCYIGANSTIGERSLLGSGCRIESNVTIYHDVTMGSQVTVHSGSVIGADGFGFAPDGDGGWQKIHQIGGVKIGDRVEVGACSTIDRGAIGDTIIGSGVILDNHIQIAHNVRLGDNVAMAAYAAIAGSSVIGDNCVLAGDAAVYGHLQLADRVQVTARSTVTKSITESGSYSNAALPLMKSGRWRRNAVGFAQLATLASRLDALDKKTRSSDE